MKEPMKTCTKCGHDQNLTEFHKKFDTKDGLSGTCKSCKMEYAKSDVCKASGARHQKSEAYKLTHLKAVVKYNAANVIKLSAHYLVKMAIKDGKISKGTYCVECGKEHGKLQGHHDDYNHPLLVRWLCPPCHKDWHKLHGSGING